MEALAASGEVGGARGAIFKQMAEMKKKIQLVEGERKAIFEDSEREKNIEEFYTNNLFEIRNSTGEPKYPLLRKV